MIARNVEPPRKAPAFGAVMPLLLLLAFSGCAPDRAGREGTVDLSTALQEQQDGDYFLSTLIARPFSKNGVISDNVNIDFH